VTDIDDLVNAWIADVLARHASAFTRPELLKAIRALSARYVERRSELPRRSAADSAGKRAAFAAFYAPLHFVTVRAIAERLDAPNHAARSILDLGCGTGVVSAGWAVAQRRPCTITGVDLDVWALGEARATWRAFGLRGRTLRADFANAIERNSETGRRSDAPSSLLVFGWALNEITAPARDRVLDDIERHVRSGAGLLVVEPVARAVSPWWPDWTTRLASSGARADEWRFDDPLPATLADLDEAAGFDRDELTARSLWIAPAR
jgi:SAM-dependent methyltransferase